MNVGNKVRVNLWVYTLGEDPAWREFNPDYQTPPDWTYEAP